MPAPPPVTKSVACCLSTQLVRSNAHPCVGSLLCDRMPSAMLGVYHVGHSHHDLPAVSYVDICCYTAAGAVWCSALCPTSHTASPGGHAPPGSTAAPGQGTSHGHHPTPLRAAAGCCSRHERKAVRGGGSQCRTLLLAGRQASIVVLALMPASSSCTIQLKHHHS